jgi:hypothetical protein
MHRRIMKAPKGFDIDHINFNKIDNRKNNLRIITRAENNIHREKYKCNKTGFKGVKFRKGLSKPFMARIVTNKKEIYLGWFKTPEEAAEAYNKAAVIYHKQFSSPSL